MFEDKKLKMIVALLLVIGLIATTVTISNLNDDDSELVSEVKESDYQITPGSIFPDGQMQSDAIILQGEDYEALPVTAPLLALLEIDTFLDWGTGDEVDVEEEELRRVER